MSGDSPHVVWWGLWKGALGVIHYSKKHFTENSVFTLCGRSIPIGGNIAFFPKTDDDPTQVTCIICKKARGTSHDRRRVARPRTR